MGVIKVHLPDELEEKFRKTAMRIYGYKKGSLSTASKKAFSEWLSQVPETMEMVGMTDDPVEAIEGMLAHVDKDGVELQHEARKIRAEKTEEEV